jgi:hypothetical protein
MPNINQETKICTKCGLDKPLGLYTATHRGKLKVQSECKACASSRVRAYQATHNPAEKQRARRIERRLAEVRDGKRLTLKWQPGQDQITRFRGYKESNPCSDCDEYFPYFVMQFDHITNDKVAQVSDFLHSHDWKALWLEIAKCELVCTCCHRLRTEARGFKFRPIEQRVKRVRIVLREGEDRQCSACLRWLTRDSFWQIWNGRLATKCRDCALDAQTYWRRAGGMSRILETRRRRRAEAREYVRKLKEASPCRDCERSKPSAAMDFDHVGAKRENVSWLVSRGVTLSRLKEEIALCEIVCANCHQIRGHERRTLALLSTRDTPSGLGNGL